MSVWEEGGGSGGGSRGLGRVAVRGRRQANF